MSHWDGREVEDCLQADEWVLKTSSSYDHSHIYYCWLQQAAPPSPHILTHWGGESMDKSSFKLIFRHCGGLAATLILLKSISKQFTAFWNASLKAWLVYFIFNLFHLAGNLSVDLLVSHVQLHVQSNDLLLHESKVIENMKRFICCVWTKY